MNHFLYLMDGEAQAPAGMLTTQEWFYRYKRDVEGLAFVPILKAEEYETHGVAPGDLLWFGFLGGKAPPTVVGRVVVDSVLGLECGRYPEVWYSGEDVDGRVLLQDHQPGWSDMEPGLHAVPLDLGEAWLGIYGY